MVSALLAAGSAWGNTLRVHPGQSIQAVLDRAQRGDRVLVEPGTYRERGRKCPGQSKRTCAVSTTRDGISIVGQGSTKHPVMLVARKGQDIGIAVGRASSTCLDESSQRVHGSLISGLTVRGFGDTGVLLLCVDHWRITHLRAVANHEYGTFPSHTVSGRLDHSFASGASDTGHYICQSRQARVDDNVAQDNVSGFEIENSSHVRLDHNLAKGNTAGFLSFALPGLSVKSNTDNQIDHNRSERNNRLNTCLDPEDIVCKVPSGTGILLLATDRNRVESNRVTGNNSLGIAVSNYCVAGGLSPSACAALDIDPDPDDNRITSNTATGNGGKPDPSVPPGLNVDLAWDLTGTGNCWSGNSVGTSFPLTFPPCP